MDVNIQRIQTAQLRQVGADETFHVKITPAIQASGLGDGGSFCFDIDSIEKYGKILAIGDSKTINENNREFTYNVRRGTENGNLWLPIPAEALSVLGVNLENGTLVNDAPRLTVWAGPEMLFFKRKNTVQPVRLARELGKEWLPFWRSSSQ